MEFLERQAEENSEDNKCHSPEHEPSEERLRLLFLIHLTTPDYRLLHTRWPILRPFFAVSPFQATPAAQEGVNSGPSICSRIQNASFQAIARKLCGQTVALAVGQQQQVKRRWSSPRPLLVGGAHASLHPIRR